MCIFQFNNATSKCVLGKNTCNMDINKSVQKKTPIVALLTTAKTNADKIVVSRDEQLCEGSSSTQ